MTELYDARICIMTEFISTDKSAAPNCSPAVTGESVGIPDVFRPSDETQSVHKIINTESSNQQQLTQVEDRNSILEKIKRVKREGKVYLAQNDFFHNRLVEYLTRKQMTWAFEISKPDEPIPSKYERKLAKYEKLRQEIQSAEDVSNADLTLLREELQKDTREADTAIEDLISRERQVRLRDSLLEKELILEHLNTLAPKLDQQDYERLEAENFYCEKKMQKSTNQFKQLICKCQHLCRCLRIIESKNKTLSRIIQSQREMLLKLNDKIEKITKQTIMRKVKIKQLQSIIHRFESVLALRMHPHVLARVGNVKDEHGEWLDKIATIINEIRKNNECMKALDANLILHKEIEIPDEDEISDESEYVNEKCRLPPLGGGFLQVLQHQCLYHQS